jgi:hypothetical protein
VQEDTGRDRYIERLDPGSEADADTPVGSSVKNRTDACAFVAHYQQYRRTLGRA